MKNYPLIAVVGTSGSGKSRSIKNLPPESTVILNIENKSLPFEGANKFTRNIELADTLAFENELTKALADSSVKVIVVESFTMYADKLLQKGKKIATGWEIYNFLNDKVSEFLDKIKSNNGKIVIVLAIDEIVKMMSASGAETNQRRIKIEGKKHEGKIEYHFPIVLFTLAKAEKDKPTSYYFATNSDGLITAKSPEGMFPQLVPNDLDLVVKRVKEYYELQ